MMVVACAQAGATGSKLEKELYNQGYMVGLGADSHRTFLLWVVGLRLKLAG